MLGWLSERASCRPFGTVRDVHIRTVTIDAPLAAVQAAMDYKPNPVGTRSQLFINVAEKLQGQGFIAVAPLSRTQTSLQFEFSPYEGSEFDTDLFERTVAEIGSDISRRAHEILERDRDVPHVG